MKPAWPAVASKLVALIPSLPSAAGLDLMVFDGQPTTQDRPSHYVTVGYVSDDNGGTWSQARDPNGFSMTETGEVRCHFASMTGDSTVTQVRDEVFTLIGDLQTYINSDQTLDGVLSQDGECAMAAEVRAELDSQGVAQSVVVTFRYWTSTY